MGKVKRTKANRRHLLANKTSRQRKTGKVLDAYADKSCKKQLKNYYHMVDNQLEKKQNKEGEKKMARVKTARTTRARHKKNIKTSKRILWCKTL